jgi:metal-responsive CopG/Arc/MetJ family transcriptional regulator
MSAILRKKTSVSVDKELWRNFVVYVAQLHGSGRKISDTLENAIREYIQNHPVEL